MKNKFRFWIIFSVLVAFVAGILGGFWVERYFAKNKRMRFGPRPPREAVYFPSLEQMSRELELSIEQQEKIRIIFEKNDARLKELRSDMHSRLTEIRTTLKNELDAILTPEQRKRFEAMIETYLLRRKKEFEKRRINQKERSSHKFEGGRR